MKNFWSKYYSANPVWDSSIGFQKAQSTHTATIDVFNSLAPPAFATRCHNDLDFFLVVKKEAEKVERSIDFTSNDIEV